MPEFLMTESGERVEIPDVVIGQSNDRDLVVQYVKASPAQRAQIAKRAQSAADKAAAERAAHVKAEGERKDALIALHDDLRGGRITSAAFEKKLASLHADGDAANAAVIAAAVAGVSASDAPPTSAAE